MISLYLQGLKAHYNGDKRAASAYNCSALKWNVAAIVIGSILVNGIIQAIVRASIALTHHTIMEGPDCINATLAAIWLDGQVVVFYGSKLKFEGLSLICNEICVDYNSEISHDFVVSKKNFNSNITTILHVRMRDSKYSAGIPLAGR